MAKMIGLSRNLKEPWLNKVAELAIEDLTEDEVKNHQVSIKNLETGKQITVDRSDCIKMLDL